MPLGSPMHSLLPSLSQLRSRSRQKWNLSLRFPTGSEGSWKAFSPNLAGFRPGKTLLEPKGSMDSDLEIVKHTQKEAFSKVKKLADRQDKAEHTLSYKFANARPYQEHSTPMKGIIDVVGILLFARNEVQESCEALFREGVKNGIHTRLLFETDIGQKDSLVVEFATRQDHPLALENLTYSLGLKKLSSAISIALGAQCDNFAVNPSRKQGLCRRGFFAFGPPCFSWHHSLAAGIVFKGSKISASLAELVSGIGMQQEVTTDKSCSTTFCQVSYQQSEEVRVNIFGIFQNPEAGLIKLHALTIPLNKWKLQPGSDGAVQASAGAGTEARLVALMLDVEVDEGSKLGVWLEARKSNPFLMKWGISLSDMPNDSTGWGFKLRGTTNGQMNIQMEGSLKFSLGKNYVLQPGLVLVKEARRVTPAFIFQFGWCM